MIFRMCQLIIHNTHKTSTSRLLHPCSLLPFEWVKMKTGNENERTSQVPEPDVAN